MESLAGDVCEVVDCCDWCGLCVRHPEAWEEARDVEWNVRRDRSDE